MPSGILSESTTELGARIRTLRERHGLTQRQLAAMVGTLQNRVSDWEIGLHQPTLPSLEKLAAAFGITVADMLDDVEASGDELVLLQRIAGVHGMTLSELLEGVM